MGVDRGREREMRLGSRRGKETNEKGKICSQDFALGSCHVERGLEKGVGCDFESSKNMNHGKEKKLRPSL